MSSDSKLRRDLFQSLEDVGRIGDEHHAAFATQGVLPEAINPGLSIKGLGTIGLPLSTRDEAGLIKVCHQAPFGKGSETFVDTNVRNTLEVNADQLELRNPAWPKALAGVLQDVSNSMGIVGGATSIKAELYRLLLYKEGAFFDKHTESVLIIDHEKQQLTGIKHQKDTGYVWYLGNRTAVETFRRASRGNLPRQLPKTGVSRRFRIRLLISCMVIFQFTSSDHF